LDSNETKTVYINYTTPEPESTETIIGSTKKRVVISSDIHYTNISAFTQIDNRPEDKIHLYHIINNTGIEVEFTAIDLDNDTLIDRIKWIVPSLSDQIYEIVIEITKAEHLDENRTFLSDIYDEVKFKDNNWSEPIYNKEYVRVTFESTLDSNKDITLYVRSNSTSEIEVYTMDNDTLIAKFEGVTGENWYKVLLLNMNGSNSTFDLRTSGDFVEYDYIVDPPAQTSVDTISPYLVKTSPYTITATNSTLADNVTLYYRHSSDNYSWAITIEGVETNQTSLGLSLNINKPTGIQDNDVLFAFVAKGDNPVITGPGGWTEVAQNGTIAGRDLGSGIWYKMVTDAASEPTSYSWTGDNEEWSGGIIILRGVDNNNPLDVNTTHSNGTNNGDPTCPSITTVTNGSMVFACAAITHGPQTSSTAPGGTIKQWSEYVINANTYCANLTQTTAGPTGDLQWDTSGGTVEEWHTCQIAFRPEFEGGWRKWNNGSNPDGTYPFSWGFDFPNETGYYEFYSIGNVSGEPNESAPGNADAICYYNPLGYPPTIELVNPAPNGTTGVSTQPNCQIWANDTDSGTLDVYWYENSTGSYILRNTNSSVSANQTVSYTFSEFGDYGIEYYWKVAVNDSNYNVSAWFSFTTKTLDTSVDTISPYIITSSPKAISATNNTPVDNVTLYYRWSEDNETWTVYKIITVVANETASNTGTQLEINKPAGLQGGDILFAFVAKDDDAGTLSGPTGWIQDTYTETVSGRDLTTGIWYKIVNVASDEATNSSYNWTHDDVNQEMSGGIAIIRGVNITNPIDVTTVWNAGSNNQNIVCPSITTVNASAGVFACAAKTHSPTTATNPSGTDKTWTMFQSWANTYVAFYLQTNAGATGTKTWIDDVVQEWHSYQIAFTPAESTNNFTDWRIWSDATNPDTASPWNWDFNFPNSTGYYEFLSIGKKTGSANETSPVNADAICLFNRFPTITNEGPSNGSINVELAPQMNITVNDSDAETMIITWYSNSSGSWLAFGMNSSVINGTYYQTNSNFSDIVKTYWWNITVNDGVHTNTSDTFFFTTLGVSPPFVFTNATTGVEETNATLNAYLSTNGSFDTTCGFRFGTSSGSYSENFTKGIYPIYTEFSNNNGSLSQGQIYYYQAWAYNSQGFVSGKEMTFLTKPDPPSDLGVQMNNSNILYLNWTVGTGANNTYIERNQSGVTTWSIGDGTLVYNGSGINCEDTGLTSGTTYYYQAWSYANWTYDSTTLYQWSDNNASDSNTTNNVPTISLISPSPNSTTDVGLQPICQIWANDTDGDTLDVFWYENSSGSYILRNTNSSVSANQTVSYTFSEFGDYGINYYWMIAVNDTRDNVTYWFYFTSKSLDTFVNTISPYNITSSPLTITASNNTPVDNVTLYYRWSDDNLSWHNGNWTNLHYDDFEDGTSGNFTGYGVDTDYFVDSSSQIFGTYTLHLEDNTNSYWALTNDIPADTNGYSQIKVDLSWKARAFNNPGSEDWWFQYYNGSSLAWETVYDYDCGAGTYIWDEQSAGNYYTNPAVLNHIYYFNESEGWNLSDDFNIRFYADMSGNGDELDLDNIYINATTGFVEWNNVSNPDTISPWSWDFDFPDGLGYYEFYSIGNKSGSANESPPGIADAICQFAEDTTIYATPSQWEIGTTTIGNYNYSTSGFYFNLTNNGTITLDVQIKGSNATNSTTGAQWNLTTIPEFNNFSLRYNKSGGSSWTNINTTYDTFVTNLGVNSWQTFDLNIFMATTSSTGDPLSLDVTFKSVAS